MNAAATIDRIRAGLEACDRDIALMEVCGTHTVAAFRSGLRGLLPAGLHLLSGPGCPVCVTPASYVDRAIAIAREPGTVVTTFGDMIRVPGTHMSLQEARARGAAVQIVYSASDALDLARKHPDMQVVFLGVGFETTAPGIAWTVRQAAEEGVTNYAVLTAHKVMPPAMDALLAAGDVRIDGFLCPGHVSAVIGAAAYRPLVRQYGLPCVVTGFEPEDMLQGVLLALRQLQSRQAEVEIQYTRAVSWEPNPAASAILEKVFRPCDAEWRGLGTLPGSGLALRERFARHDAAVRFGRLPVPGPADPPDCRCGDVLRGVCAPPECPLFGSRCTPASPVGACMVSSEGACAAFFRFGDN